MLVLIKENIYNLDSKKLENKITELEKRPYKKDDNT